MKIQFDDECGEENTFYDIGENTYNDILAYAKKRIISMRESLNDLE